MPKNKTAPRNSVAFYLVIVLLTAAIIAAGSLPYLLSHRGKTGEKETTQSRDAGFPKNGDGVDRYGRPDLEGKELRGVWVAYLSLENVDRALIDGIIAQCRDNAMNTIYLHVRPFGDALYRSDYYPWSHLCKGTQGEAPDGGFDPLAYAVEAAHREGIALHAWLNPLRIMLPNGKYPPALSEDNPYTVWRNDSDPSNDDWVIDYQKGKYYNPAYPEVREFIVKGTREIVERYHVDGIHWDDYFYPAYDGTFDDSVSYAAYQAKGGSLTLLDWRTDNINKLVKAVYAAVKEADSNCLFGISPAGNIDNCLRMGAEVTRWGSEPGFVDYLIPQVYWSSDNTICPFEPTCRRWNRLVTSPGVKLYIGLALYKAGSDMDNGKWRKADDIIKNQILYTRSGDIASEGFVMYSYAYFDTAQTAEEMKNIRSVLN